MRGPAEVKSWRHIGEKRHEGLQRPSLGRDDNKGDIPVRRKGAEEPSSQNVSRLAGGRGILSVSSGGGTDRCCECPAAWGRRPHMVGDWFEEYRFSREDRELKIIRQGDIMPRSLVTVPGLQIRGRVTLWGQVAGSAT